VITNIFDNQRHQLENKLKLEDRANGKKPVHDFASCFKALQAGSRCWAHFTSEVDNGWDLFRRLNGAKIREVAAGIDAKSSGGAFSAALKLLWNGADQDEWNAKARNYKNVPQCVSDLSLMACMILDTSLVRNQAEFPDLAYETLECLCQFKQLGDLEVLFFFSFRNSRGKAESFA
jgi:hypothetical protein